MKKQEVFPLYVGRCNLYFSQSTAIEKFQGIKLFGDKDDEVWFKVFTDKCTGSTYNTSDQCQLILKRIKNMSEEERDYYDKLQEDVSNTEYTNDCLEASREMIFWLIQHGYALNDDWFTNGIAVEASQIAEKEEK